MQPNESLYEQTPEESAPSLTNNSGTKSSFASRFEDIDDDSHSGGESGGGTLVLSHVAEPPKSSSSSSSTSSNKYADRESDEEVSEKKGLWSSVVNIAVQMKKALTTRRPPIDIYFIRSEVTEVMEKLHASDAETIPRATREDMVNQLNCYVIMSYWRLCDDYEYGPIIESCRKDVLLLLNEIYPPIIDTPEN
ncbi:unnamed protein product [Arabidopsis halleri]